MLRRGLLGGWRGWIAGLLTGRSAAVASAAPPGTEPPGGGLSRITSSQYTVGGTVTSGPMTTLAYAAGGPPQVPPGHRETSEYPVGGESAR